MSATDSLRLELQLQGMATALRNHQPSLTHESQLIVLALCAVLTSHEAIHRRLREMEARLELLSTKDD